MVLSRELVSWLDLPAVSGSALLALSPSLEEQPCSRCSLTVTWGHEALQGGLKSDSFHIACSYRGAAGSLLEICSC